MKNEERIEILEDARDSLTEVIQQVRDAVHGTSEMNRADAYILPHLGTWLDDPRGSSGTCIESLIEEFSKVQDYEIEILFQAKDGAGDFGWYAIILPEDSEGDPEDEGEELFRTGLHATKAEAGYEARTWIEEFKERLDDPEPDDDPGDHGDDLAPYDPPDDDLDPEKVYDLTDGDMPRGWVQAAVVEGSYRIGDMVRVVDENDRPVALEVVVLSRGGFLVPEITDLDMDEPAEGLSSHPRMSLSNGQKIDLKEIQPIVLDPATENRPANSVQVSFHKTAMYRGKEVPGSPGVFNLDADGKYQVQLDSRGTGSGHGPGFNRFEYRMGRDLETGNVIWIDGKWKTLLNVYPIR